MKILPKDLAAVMECDPAVSAALKLASETEGKKIVAILPDRGERYLSTGIFE